MIRRKNGSYTWDGVDIHPYKEDGSHFKSISRQTLLNVDKDLPVEFRYFEIGVDGHSTLERHVHQHAVMVIRGSGEVLVGESVTPIGLHDLVYVPTLTWHQFRATKGEELGFLCIVNNDRDRPQRPTEQDIAELQAIAEVERFIRL